MKNNINFNGTLTDVLPGNGQTGRGYRYGDGLFETIRLEGGVVPLLRYHVARLRRGLLQLGIADNDRYTAAWLAARVGELTGPGDTGRLRLTVTRVGGGKYSPDSDNSSFVLEFTPGVFSAGWVGPALSAGLSEQLRMPTHPLANLKTTSALAYVQAARERRAAGWDEILLRNHYGRLSEGGRTNLFVRHPDGGWCTPPATEGGVSGVLRARLLERAPAQGLAVRELPLTVQALREARAVVCTNALYGLHPVRRIGQHTYTTAALRELLPLLPPLPPTRKT